MDWREVQQLVFGSTPKTTFQPCATGELGQGLRVSADTRELIERALELYVQAEYLDMEALYSTSNARLDLHAQKELRLWKTTVATKLKRLSGGCDTRQQQKGILCPHLLALLGAARLKLVLEEQRRRTRGRQVDAAPVATQMKEFRTAIVKSRVYKEAFALFVDACGDADTLAYCMHTPRSN
jgi:hypothetical protein